MENINTGLPSYSVDSPYDRKLLGGQDELQEGNRTPSVPAPVNYVSRTKIFAILSALISVITAVPLMTGMQYSAVMVFPIAFAFSYLAYKSDFQARIRGIQRGYWHYLAFAPFAVFIGICASVFYPALAKDDGWGSFAVLITLVFMIPGAIAAYILAFIISARLKEDPPPADAGETTTPVLKPKGFMISVFRIGTFFFVLFALYIFYLISSFG